jgi:hypothetical protein
MANNLAETNAVLIGSYRRILQTRAVAISGLTVNLGVSTTA